jgi:hypothetical protein
MSYHLRGFPYQKAENEGFKKPDKDHTFLLRYFHSAKTTIISNDLLHGSEFFLRNQQFLSSPRMSQHFMELRVLLSCSQELNSGLYPEPESIRIFIH